MRISTFFISLSTLTICFQTTASLAGLPTQEETSTSDDRVTAEEYYHEGLIQLNKGDLEQARDRFQASLDLTEDHKTRYYLAEISSKKSLENQDCTTSSIEWQKYLEFCKRLDEGEGQVCGRDWKHHASQRELQALKGSCFVNFSSSLRCGDQDCPAGDKGIIISREEPAQLKVQSYNSGYLYIIIKTTSQYSFLSHQQSEEAADSDRNLSLILRGESREVTLQSDFSNTATLYVVMSVAPIAQLDELVGQAKKSNNELSSAGVMEVITPLFSKVKSAEKEASMATRTEKAVSLRAFALSR